MREADLAAVEAAAGTGDQAGLDAASGRIGCALSLAGVQRLGELAGALTRSQILLTVHDAIVQPHGIAIREREGRYRYRTICVAVRTQRFVCVGVTELQLGTSLGTRWPGLKPWFKELARNRERAEAWAEGTGDDRVRFELVARAHEPARTIDDAELIAQIVDNPHDRELRLVLADKLLEREDPRGELVRLGLVVADTLDGPERIDLETQIRALEQRHGPRIAGEIAERAEAYSIAGGFVDSVVMTAGRFAEHGDRLFRAHPIRQLEVRPLDAKAIRRLAKTPHVALLRALVLSAAWPHNKVWLAPLARLDYDRLEELELRDCELPLDDELLADLVAPRLHTLRLLGARVGGAALCGLAENRALCDRITTLELDHLLRDPGPTRPDPDVEALFDTAFQTLAMPALATLSLRAVWFASDARVGAMLARTPALASLQIDFIGPHIAAALGRSRSLRALTLTRDLPGPAELAMLFAAPSLVELRFLDDRLDPDDSRRVAAALLALPEGHPLRSVRLPPRPPKLFEGDA